MRLAFLFLFILWTRGGFAEAKPAAEKREKLQCSSKELLRQDCRLSSRGYSIRLLGRTVVWNDGTWHTVDPLPLEKETVEWERVNFQFLAGRPILQLWFWGDGLGETKVQSLHWYVTDGEKRKFTILSEGVVRKRRQEPPKPIEGFDKPKVLPKPKYLYDGWETQSLKALPHGNLEWRLGDKKKLLTFPQAEPQVQKETEQEKKHGI
jgi:hypothetical protein